MAKHRNFLVRKRTHDFLLRGFAYCHYCGERYTAEWHIDKHKLKKRGGKIAYYHCQKREKSGCPAKYIEMDSLEVLVEKRFKEMQFSQEFTDTVVRKTREILEEGRATLASRRQGLFNNKTSLETKRNKLEDALLDGTIDRDTFKRKHSEIQAQIIKCDTQIQEIEAKNRIDVDLIEEVLAFTRNIYKTYKQAPKFLKRHYLRFFFEKVMVKDKGVLEVVPTPIFAILRANHQVIITNSLLPLKDMFINREIEFDYSLENLKILYSKCFNYLTSCQ
ncbi:MAG: hypothetical protein A3A58_03155 [Candidatus Blackburnbacteria bacterium RIFCSPLOWO2_01_FULL_41_27]|uniref:Recombinase zinc beta ribbon domain-containing protein n=2 Tax=Candidatus Blackburniibacteriota TaxID=1817898 RepID=A0A1G1VGT8_9BACT|nr:MAG: hypothetical protein A3A58_03155 [Candidatus Blackburnbacteria bacterium RIFCSPLOWO2_01_FULL_41_27]